jgi:hypothetical protein
VREMSEKDWSWNGRESVQTKGSIGTSIHTDASMYQHMKGCERMRKMRIDASMDNNVKG